MATEKKSHFEVWSKMPGNTAKERLAKAWYYNENRSEILLFGDHPSLDETISDEPKDDKFPAKLAEFNAEAIAIAAEIKAIAPFSEIVARHWETVKLALKYGPRHEALQARIAKHEKHDLRQMAEQRDLIAVDYQKLSR